MAENETQEIPAMMTAEEFFELYTKPMEGESDLSPLMYYQGAKANLCVFADTPSHEDGGIQAMLRGTVANLKREQGPASWIWFGCEAYIKKAPPGGMPGLRPGQLQAEHGTDPEIKECIVLTGVCRDGVSTAQRIFERRDGEVIWLSDLESNNADEISGGVPLALMGGLA